MKNRMFSLLVVLTLTMLLFGCSKKDEGNNANMSLLQKTDPPAMDINKVNYGESIEDLVKKAVQKEETIYDVVVVKREKKILAAYKVKHLKRFKMKKIEKELKKKLNKEFPGYSFIVSSDYKIFLEAAKLNETLQKESYPQKKAEKRFKDIVKLQKEKT